MTRVHRSIVLWGLPIALFLGVALFAPRPGPVVERIGLAITVLAGSYALAYALIGLVTRQVRPPVAMGLLALAAGAFLLGVRYLPAVVPGTALLTTLGAALLLVGVMVVARG